MADVRVVTKEAVAVGVSQALLNAVIAGRQGFHGLLQQLAYVFRFRPIAVHAATVALLRTGAGMRAWFLPVPVSRCWLPVRLA